MLLTFLLLPLSQPYSGPSTILVDETSTLDPSLQFLICSVIFRDAELGWQIDHFLGYFGITLLVCFAWARPFVVGGVFVAVAALLEGLQAFTPDRSANLEAALCGAGGALAGALVAQLFIRAWRWRVNDARSAKRIQSPRPFYDRS